MNELQNRLRKRIDHFIVDTDNCILYPCVNRDGYGDLQYYNSENRKRHYLAHRLSYEIANNCNLSSEELVLHRCDVPGCINPKHLFKGTHKDNVDDKMAKGRGVYLFGKNNHRYKHGHNAKVDHVPKPEPEFKDLFQRSLGREEVIAVKNAIANRGSKSIRQLSDDFGYKYQTLRDINAGRAYKNIK